MSVERQHRTAAPAPATARSRETLLLGVAGSLLCAAAHPPLGWSLLAWIGPAPWMFLCRQPDLPGRRPYRALWLAGALYWLLAVHWIRLPHPANWLGLPLLALYLGAYLPLMVGLTRVGVQRMGMPVWVAAPLVWTGLEWLRARLFTGFLMASLAHTQVGYPRVIQIADVLGEYGVTFLIVMVAATIAEAAWQLRSGAAGSLRRLAAGTAAGLTAIAATLAYGQFRLDEASDAVQQPARGRTIALIQSDMLADWKGTPERDVAVMRDLFELSREAAGRSSQPVDMVVWPETMFRQPWYVPDPDNPPPEGSIHPSQFTAAAAGLKALAEETDAALIIGIDRVEVSGAPGASGKSELHLLGHNSAVFVDRAGVLLGSYDKMHLLPFGEFIPFVEWLPFLRELSPITGRSLRGAQPAAFESEGFVYAPNICYETVLPHLIRRQVRELARQGQTPDVLVNVTNDAWFWGSSELDMHLASGVFRAVEMRTPLVIAANRGLSAHVDHLGRIQGVTERDQPAFLIASVRVPPRSGLDPSLFAAYGEWFAVACVVCCTVLALAGWRTRMLINGCRLSAVGCRPEELGA